VGDVPNERPIIGSQVLLSLILLLEPTAWNQAEMIPQWRLMLPENSKEMATDNAHPLKTKTGTKVAPVL
jgi:hypothetical protein